MTTNQVQADPRMETVVEFLLSRNPGLTAVDWEADLIDNRILDSLAFAEFFFLLEELTGAPIDLEYFDIDTIRSLEHIQHTFFVEPST